MDGIIAGQYVSPYGEIIWPELIIFGDPQIAYEFELLPYLAQGWGPWTGGVPGQAPKDSGLVGPLKPWPGVKTPDALPACTTTTPPSGNVDPIANAGPDVGVAIRSTNTQYTLTGSIANKDKVTGTPTYSWTVTPSLALTSANAPVVTFTLPGNGLARQYTFKLETKNDGGPVTSDTAVVFASYPDNVSAVCT